jgi:hypothetical protein
MRVHSTPRRTGLKSIRCSVPSANRTVNASGPMMENCVTRWIAWFMIYLSGSILTGGWPDCNKSQSCCNSARWTRPMLGRAAAALSAAATEALDGVDREHSRLLPIIGVEVRSVMPTSGLDEHPDHDSEKARELGHVRT